MLNEKVLFFICLFLCFLTLNIAYADDTNDTSTLNDFANESHVLNWGIGDNDSTSPELKAGNALSDSGGNEGEALIGSSVNEDQVLIASSADKAYALSPNENNLLAEDPNSFSGLYDLINQNQDDELILLTDYAFNSQYDSNFLNGIPINRSITIDGNGHTIDARNQSRIFDVIYNNLNVIFKNTVFINGNFANGGAIAGKSTSINCTFINNTATEYGGAIYGGSALNCSFYDNEAKEGGAIYVTGNNFWIGSCTFVNNYATETGGAVCFDQVKSSKIENCTFKRNKAKTGGALSIVYSQNVGVFNSTFDLIEKN